MATVTLELDDETFAALEAEAEKDHCSVSDFLEDLVSQRVREMAAVERGRQYAREDLERYPDVFKRLAQ